MKKLLLLTLIVGALATGCACKKTKTADATTAATNNISLYGTEWVLTKLGSQKVTLSSTEKNVNLTLVEEGLRAAGKGGCNNYSGLFTIKNDSIKFGPMRSTMMACPEVDMKTEKDYLKALDGVNRYQIQGTTLYLKKDDKTTLTFEAR